MTLTLLTYLMPLHYIFIPINLLLRNFGDILNKGFIPFSTAIAIMMMFLYWPLIKAFSKKLINIVNVYQFYFIFASTISLVFIFFAFYFLKIEEINLTSLLLVFLCVLTLYLLPLYLGLIRLEKLVLSHAETIEKPISNNRSIISEIKNPIFDEITIESEKTSDTITFQLMNLLMVEGHGNYCMFYFSKNGMSVKKIMNITMKTVQENLSKYSQIIRCHKSFIVNIDNVVRVSGISRRYVLHFENQEISAPVSRLYQEEAMKSIHIFKECVLQN